MTKLQKQQMKKLIDKHTKFKMEVIEFLYDNRKKFQNADFRYPYSMPEELRVQLSSEDVDIIEDNFYMLDKFSIKDLCQMFNLSF